MKRFVIQREEEYEEPELTPEYCQAWLSAFYYLFSNKVSDIEHGVELAEKCIQVSSYEEPYVEVTAMIRRGHLFRYEHYSNEKRLSSMKEDFPVKQRSPFCDMKMLSYNYALSIIRMVNAVTDRDFRNYTLEEQRRTRIIHNSVKERAEQRNMPQELVDARHAATHANMPSLEHLELCSCIALTYLCRYYWIPMSQKILQQCDSFDSVTLRDENLRETEFIDDIPMIARTMEAYPTLTSDSFKETRSQVKKALSTGKQSAILRSLSKILSQSSHAKEQVLPSSGISVPLPPGFLSEETE